MKKLNPLFVATSLLTMVALACGGSLDDSLPATLPPSDEAPPTETPEGGGVDSGFFVLNLSDGDQEGLEQRANEIYQSIINNGGEVDRSVILEAYAELNDYERVGGEWQAVGPGPIDGVYMPQGRINGSGRVNGFAVDPRNPQVVYAAASVGGIWKTTDGGDTWRPLTDNQVPLIFGGIVMHPDDPDTLYGLLGEFDGQVGSTYGYLVNGILRTTDGGATWDLIGANDFNAASVTALVFDKEGDMYAATGQTAVYEAPEDQPEFGIFKSTDGGDSWDRLLSCSDFFSCVPRESSGITAYLGGFMDLDIAGDGTLFTSLCRVECFGTKLLRSQDGGASWEELDMTEAAEAWAEENEINLQYLDQERTIPLFQGFEVGTSQSDPNIVLAGGGIYWENDSGDEGPWSWVIRSQDGGDSWEWLPNAGDYCTGGGGSPQCTYDNIVEIDPTDANRMYVGGSFSLEEDTYNWIAVIRGSDDGGDNWRDMTPAEDESLMHPDAHGLLLDPTNPTVAWVGGDGGIYYTEDITEDPPTWESKAEGMDTLLFIDVAVHPTDPDYFIGGLQDNARAFTTDSGGRWEGAASGDGAYVAVDPFDPEIVYGTIYPPTIFERNEQGGEGDYAEWAPSSFANGYTEGLDGSDNWLFYPPFTVDPNNEGVLYLVSNRVYRSTDRADEWEAVSDYLNSSNNGSIQSIEVAKADSDVIYAGTTDGTLWVTTDGGEDWDEITDSDFPARNITRIATNPENAEEVYVVFGGFNVQTPNTEGHVFKSDDGGKSWENISANLPDAPLSSVVVDVRSKYAGVYVGGALGVWVLSEGSDDWLPYGTGMPYTLVSSLKLNPETGVMAAATYGRSIWVMRMP